MDNKSLIDQKVDVDFESHPPIEEDLNGVATLLRQSFFQFVDCNKLASYLICQKDATQVIAQGATERGEESSDDEDADDDIYGVISSITLPEAGTKVDATKIPGSNNQKEEQNDDVTVQLVEFLAAKCPKLKDLLDNSNKEEPSQCRYAMIVNERYINLPPQLALPTLKTLTEYLNGKNYTHLIVVAKILLKSRNTNTNLPSKKSKQTNSGDSPSKGSSSHHEPLVYMNPEEEIIFEHSEHHTDVDVSSYCDENATWSFGGDIKYTPHRRIMLIDYKRWPTILQALEEELK